MSRFLRFAEDTETNASAAATLAGFTADKGNQLLVEGFIISASGAPAAAVQATLAGPDTGTMHINIPAAAFAPIVVMFPQGKSLRVTPGSNAVLTVPALGAGIVCTATLFGSVG